MNNINILLEMQENHIRIRKCEKSLKDTAHVGLLRNLKIRFERKKENYKDKDKEIESVRKIFNEDSNKIELLNQEIKKGEYDLYNNVGSNIELIEMLQDKMEQLNDSIKVLDLESIGILEKEEILNKEKEQLRLELKEIKTSFYNQKDINEKNVGESNEEIKQLKEKIKELEKLVPCELVKIYNEISNSKGTGVAELQQGVCTGCKMRVSSLTVDSINKDKELVYCDNCGRILYSNHLDEPKVEKKHSKK